MSARLPRLIVVICCGFTTSPGFAGEGSGSMEAPIAPIGPTDRGEPEELDVRRPTVEGVPTLQMTPNFVSPALAFGGYFPTAQIEAGAIRMEPFTVRAAFYAGIGYDDNVTLTSRNKISSVFYTVAPSVAIGLEGATQRYYAVYRGNYGAYSSASQSNYDNHNLGILAFHDFTSRLRSSLQYDFLRGHDPLGSTESSTEAPDVWNLHALRGSVTYGAVDARGRIITNVGYARRQYTNNREVTAVRDYEQWDIGGQFSYRMAPKTRASIEVGHSEVSHSRDPLADSTENRYLIGIEWEATAKTHLGAKVGYLTRDFANPTTSEFSSPTYEVSATWAPLEYSSLSFSANRTSAEAIEAGSNFVVVDVATVTWNHAWFDRIRSTVGYLYGQQRHEGIGRSDTYQTFDTKLSYAFSRRLRLGLQFRHDARESPEPGLDYRRNLTLLTLESTL